MDRRMQKTRSGIFYAFNRLLSRKSYSKITIQEIIDEADIGRSTFYAHFETKDDLLKAMCQNLFDHIFSDDLQAEETHDFSLSKGQSKSLLAHILYHLKDDEKNLHGVLCSENSDLFWNYIRQQFSRFIQNYILNVRTDKSCHIPDDLLSNHISGTFVELAKWWMHNGMKESPEELEKYFEMLIFPII
jgi:AcrR family transcriptional regulator